MCETNKPIPPNATPDRTLDYNLCEEEFYWSGT